MVNAGEPIRRSARFVRHVDPETGLVDDQFIDEELTVLHPNGRIDQYYLAHEGFACGCPRHDRVAKFRCSCGALVCADCPVAGFSHEHEPLCGSCSRIIDAPDHGSLRVTVDEHDAWRWHQAVAAIGRMLLAPFVRRGGQK